jgi:hypothetical protein
MRATAKAHAEVKSTSRAQENVGSLLAIARAVVVTAVVVTAEQSPRRRRTISHTGALESLKSSIC